MNTSRRNARGESTLRSILSETASLVSNYGYDATTIARISKSTGKPASSIYWFFDTKDELIAASLESTYKHSAHRISKWPAYVHGQGLRKQLERIMVEQLRGSPSERPVRLGLMVALEGAASNEAVQEPFSSRRRAVRNSLGEWWLNVARLHEIEKPEHVATQMMRLTVAFLDGHYISDTEQNDLNLEYKASFSAACLDRAFAELSSGEQTVMHERRPVLDVATPVTENHDILLRVTRNLVSARGYEGATLARICEHSGMKRSSVYWRYSDKDKLVDAAVAGPFLEIMASNPGDQRASKDDAVRFLASSLAESVKRGIRDRESVRAGLLMKLQHRQPPSAASTRIQEALAEQEISVSRWLADEVGVEERQAAAVAWGDTVLTEGMMLAIAFGQDQNVEALLDVASSMYDSALQPVQAIMDR